MMLLALALLGCLSPSQASLGWPNAKGFMDNNDGQMEKIPPHYDELMAEGQQTYRQLIEASEAAGLMLVQKGDRVYLEKVNAAQLCGRKLMNKVLELCDQPCSKPELATRACSSPMSERQIMTSCCPEKLAPPKGFVF